MATKTERRKLAREARHSLATYLAFLLPHIEAGNTPEQLAWRRRYLAQSALTAVAKLAALEDEGREEG